MHAIRMNISLKSYPNPWSQRSVAPSARRCADVHDADVDAVTDVDDAYVHDAVQTSIIGPRLQ